MVKARYSMKLEKDGRMLVDCSECVKGGNNAGTCPLGGTYKLPLRGGCDDQGCLAPGPDPQLIRDTDPESQIEEAIELVRAERARQDKKWGAQNHNPCAWITILGEEFGEVCRAILEQQFGKGSEDAYLEELTHTAAVSLAMIECVLRKRAKEVHNG